MTDIINLSKCDSNINILSLNRRDLFNENWSTTLSKKFRELSLKYHPDKNNSEEAKPIYYSINNANDFFQETANFEACKDYFLRDNIRGYYEKIFPHADQSSDHFIAGRTQDQLVVIENALKGAIDF